MYAKNKDFLISENVITFTDVGGKLMALKPDVTLSIVRSTRDYPGVQKLCYDENVYRASKHDGAFRELTQVGVEYLGEIGEAEIAEILILAMESLRTISPDCKLQISHLGLLSALLDQAELTGTERNSALDCISRKNLHELRLRCPQAGGAALIRLAALSGGAADVIPTLRELAPNSSAVEELSAVCDALTRAGYGERVSLDFSIPANMNYYHDIVFHGYLNGIPDAVLSGGQYDGLMRKMGRQARAIGFAVYLDRLELLEGGNSV